MIQRNVGLIGMPFGKSASCEICTGDCTRCPLLHLGFRSCFWQTAAKTAEFLFTLLLKLATTWRLGSEEQSHYSLFFSCKTSISWYSGASFILHASYSSCRSLSLSLLYLSKHFSPCYSRQALQLPWTRWRPVACTDTVMVGSHSFTKAWIRTGEGVFRMRKTSTRDNDHHCSLWQS